MIPPEILQRKSLFALLHQIDFDLAESVHAKPCPFAGGPCITRATSVSLAAAPLICLRLTRCASVFAAGSPAAGAGCCRHRCSSGAGGFTGRRCFGSSPRCARVAPAATPYVVCKRSSGSRGQPLPDGAVTSESSLPTAGTFKVSAGGFCRRLPLQSFRVPSSSGFNRPAAIIKPP